MPANVVGSIWVAEFDSGEEDVGDMAIDIMFL